MHNTNEKLIIFFLSVTILIVFFSNLKIQQDDSYIYYNYAKNIFLGNGYVFNIGEKVNATTSPLYPLLLALIYFFLHSFGWISLPIVGHIIELISLWTICFFSMKILKEENYKNTYFIFPFIFLSIPLIRNAAGMEILLNIALIILTIYWYQKQNYNLFAIGCALSFLCRFDSALIVCILIFDYMIHYKRIIPLKYLVVFFIITIPWFLFSYLYFGTIVPSSVTIKLFQHGTEYWGTGLIFLKGMISSFPGNKSIALLFIVSFTILLIANIVFNIDFIKRKMTRIILIWTLLYYFVYSFIINPPAYPWYYTLLTIPISLTGVLSIELLFSKLSPRLVKRIIPIFLLVCFTIAFIPQLFLLNKPVSSKYKNYKEAAEWLNSNASSGNSVAIDEIGILGFYYRKGKIIDILGLINPDVMKYHEEKDYYGIIREYKPDYVITDYPNPPVYEKFVYVVQFKAEYSLSTIINNGENSISIFKKNNILQY